MIFLYVIFLSFFLARADDQLQVKLTYDPLVDVISEKYEAGPYLIYDCQEKHWVCVLEPYFIACEDQRKMDSSLIENAKHSCAPIGKFPNKISCFQRQLFLTTHHHGDRFCIKDDWKQKIQ
jgi:hypothetical protein